MILSAGFFLRIDDLNLQFVHASINVRECLVASADASALTLANLSCFNLVNSPQSYANMFVI